MDPLGLDREHLGAEKSKPCTRHDETHADKLTPMSETRRLAMPRIRVLEIGVNKGDWIRYPC